MADTEPLAGALTLALVAKCAALLDFDLPSNFTAYILLPVPDHYLK